MHGLEGELGQLDKKRITYTHKASFYPLFQRNMLSIGANHRDQDPVYAAYANPDCLFLNQAEAQVDWEDILLVRWKPLVRLSDKARKVNASISTQ